MYALACLVALTVACSAILTRGAGALGRKLGVLDLPNCDRKRHAQATPRTGGLAIVGSLLAGLALVVALPDFFPQFTAGRLTASLCLSTVLLCGVGIWDDRHGMQARTKLAWQILAIIPFALFGRASEAVSVFHWQFTNPAVTVPLILLWLVACSNFINLLDGLDGLAGSLGLIITVTAAVLAGWQQQPETLVIALVLAGSLVGFLTRNWPPARIFMGDCGSLPLGFLVGALALQSSVKKAAGLTLVVPAVLLAVPLIDTSMAIVRRKLSGRKIGHGDRGHIHHCLCDRGLSSRQTLLTVCSLSLFTAFGAAVATILGSDLLAVLIVAALLAVLIGARLFGFSETLLVARHLEAAWSLLCWFPQALRTRLVAVQLGTATAAGDLRLWKKIIRRARRMGVLEVEFRFEPVAGGQEPVRLNWSAPQVSAGAAMSWETRGTVTQGLAGTTTFRIRGLSRRGGMVAANAELSDLLTTLCQIWADHPEVGVPAETHSASVDRPGEMIGEGIVPMTPVDPSSRGGGSRLVRDAA